MKNIVTYPKINSFIYHQGDKKNKDQWVNNLNRIFFNSFKSTVQQDWKRIETKNYLYMMELEQQTILHLPRTTMEQKQFCNYSYS